MLCNQTQVAMDKRLYTRACLCILYKPLLVVYKLYHYFKSIHFLNHIPLRVLVQNFSYIAYFIESHKVLYNQTAKYQQVSFCTKKH